MQLRGDPPQRQGHRRGPGPAGEDGPLRLQRLHLY